MRKFILFLFSGICINCIVYAQSNEKMTFSDEPVTNENSKTSFTSAEYIYGSMDLGGKTVKEFFRIPEPSEEHPYPFLYYIVEAYQNDDLVGNNGWRYVLLRDADKGKMVLQFDILPEPAKVTTILCGTEKFDAGLGAGPLYDLVFNQQFKKNGTYIIKVKFYSKSLDVYGNEQSKDKWPECTGSFGFKFNENDVPVLLKNNKEANGIAAENAFKLDKLPNEFNGSKVSDPKVTAVKLSAILKRDLPERTVLKFAIGEADGALWKIAKNDLDIPRYRYFTPYIHVVYKMDGKCYVGTVELIEEYLGGGKYGPLKVGFTSAGNRKDNVIDCGKVK